MHYMDVVFYLKEQDKCPALSAIYRICSLPVQDL